MNSFVVGVDLGGTGTRFVRMDGDGVLGDRFTLATPQNGRAEEALSFFRRAFERLGVNSTAGRNGAGLAAIGVGASGPIDRAGVIRNPDTLPAFSDVDIVSLLSEDFGVPCVIDNDAVAAAVAEEAIGTARGSHDLLYVTLGTGIGVAMLINGNSLRGADGLHPEAGHITVTGLAPCYCGRSACWEQVASRSALQRDAERLTGRSGMDAINALATAAHSFSDAQRVFEKYGSRLGEGLATLVEVYRPRLVVLGGSAARYLPHFRDALDATLAATSGRMLDFRMAATELDDFGGAIGACVLAQRNLG